MMSFRVHDKNARNHEDNDKNFNFHRYRNRIDSKSQIEPLVKTLSQCYFFIPPHSDVNRYRINSLTYAPCLRAFKNTQ